MGRTVLFLANLLHRNGHARTSCAFRTTRSLKRARETLLRYLSHYTLSQKGTQHSLALPFILHTLSKRHATPSCVTFHTSRSLKKARNTLLRYLSHFTLSQKGTNHSLALPFSLHAHSKGNARLAYVTFHSTRSLKKARNTRLRYLSNFLLPQKGTQHPLALPFTLHALSKGHARTSCVTFHTTCSLKRARNTRLRYLSHNLSPRKVTRDFLKQKETPKEFLSQKNLNFNIYPNTI